MGHGVAIEMFAATPQTVNPHAMAILSWKTSRAVTCTMKKNGAPVAFPVRIPDGQSPRMTLEETTTFTMTCAGPAGPAEKSATVIMRPPPEITTFTATPSIVARDQAAALTWTTRNADACLLDPGGKTVAVNPKMPIEKKPHATTTYSLRCTGTGPDAAQSRTVVFSQVTIMSFSVTPVFFAPGMHKNVTFSWKVRGASGNCILDPGKISVPDKEGAKVLPRARTPLYTLTCPGNGGPVTATATTPPLKILAFDVISCSTGASQALCLFWKVTGAQTCTLNGAPVTRSPMREVLLGPFSPCRRYRLECTGGGERVTKTAVYEGIFSRCD